MIKVPAERLEWGAGDIAASYSADKIAEGSKKGSAIRNPFTWDGSLYVSVSGNQDEWQAYALQDAKLFTGKVTTYWEKDGEAARTDPNGFYHGMRVKRGEQEFVLCGPELTFTAEKDQPTTVGPLTQAEFLL